MNRPLDIFAMALEFEGQARAVCLDRACGDDAALRAEVESLLAAHDAAGEFLRNPSPSLESSDPQGLGAAPTRRHAPPSEQPGQMIGRYKLLQSIGEGGFGSVWMAEQKEPVKRRVALKIIKLGMDTRQVIARFEAERQALAMMDHPNIARVFDAGATETGRPYFVMELINGVPILEYCDTEKLDTKARLNLFIKVCNALQHAHQKGVIHRDIKPSNVMITLHDGVPVPKVIDFGIAKATNQELTDKTLFTQHQQMIGTPAYMSPEQAEMSGLDIDTRSDIYSLGVLLYELLTGTTPFNSDELMSKGFAEMVRIIRETEPDRPSTRLNTLGDKATKTAQQRCVDVRELGSVLRGDLDWIVMKCLEKDRSRRYETASGLATDIQRHLNDEPVSAGPPGARYRLRKFIKRNRTGVIAAAVVASVLILGIAGTTGGMLWALDQKTRAERAEQDKARELNRATEVKRLISEMLGSVDPSIAQGQDTTLLKGILDDTARRLDNGEINDELIAAELHEVIGVAYQGIGQWDLGETHIASALEIRTRLLGEEDPATLQSLSDLNYIRGLQGKVSDLIESAEKLYESRKCVLGPEHRDTLRSMAALADNYGAAQRYDEAEQLVREALAIRTRVLGPDDPDTLSSINQMAVIDFVRGRQDESKALFEEALEGYTRVYGTNHPATLRVTNSLMECNALMGDYEAALPLGLRAIETAETLLGEEHPLMLLIQTKVGRIYAAMGRDAEACPLLEMVVAKHRAIDSGLTRPNAWRAIEQLGTCYEHLDRRDEALALYRELLASLPTAADPDNAWPMALATTAWVLTRDFDELNDPARALGFAQRAVDIVQERNADRPNQQLDYMLDILAAAQFQPGDSAKALATEKQAIEQLMPKDGPDTRKAYEARLRLYESAVSEPSDR